jgi:hypothetical protein
MTIPSTCIPNYQDLYFKFDLNVISVNEGLCAPKLPIREIDMIHILQDIMIEQGEVSPAIRITRLTFRGNTFELDGGLLLLHSNFSRYSALLPITSLDLSCCKLTDAHMEYIYHILQQPDCPLKKLDLSANHLGAKASAYMRESLKANASLIELNLSNNLEIDAWSLAEGISKNSTLTSLNISNTPLTGDLARLAHALLENTTLRNLNIDRTGLEDQNVSLLMDSLAIDMSALVLSSSTITRVAD